MAISSNGVAGLKPGVVDNAAARPSSPFEGQMVYEKDVDMLAIWNGTAWRYIAATTPTNGTVLQVVSMPVVSTEVTSSTSTYIDTGISATITPKSSTSKILVFTSVSGVAKNNDTGVSLRLMRNGGQINVFEGRAGETGTSTFNNVGACSTSYLDSPATTSAVTYKVQFRSVRNLSFVAVQKDTSSDSTMILIEISA